MFLNTSGCRENLTVKEWHKTEYVAQGTFLWARKGENKPRQEERRTREEGVGEKTFPFAEQELLDAPRCLYILKNIFNGDLDSQAHFHYKGRVVYLLRFWTTVIIQVDFQLYLFIF